MIDRRQFMVRGTAAGFGLGWAAQLPAVARAAGAPADGAGLWDNAALEDGAAPTELSAGQLEVVEGLVGAICLANGVAPQEARSLGLTPPADFAAAYAACDANTRAAVSAVLSAIAQGSQDPSGLAGVLSGLAGLNLKDPLAFVTRIFADVEQYIASERDENLLDALTGATNARAASLHPALGHAQAPDQPAVTAPRTDPFTGAQDARYRYGQTLLCGLTLVSQPLKTDPLVPDLPELSAGTAAQLRRWLVDRPGLRPVPDGLLRALREELGDLAVPDVVPNVYPCVALSRALGVWLGADLVGVSLP